MFERFTTILNKMEMLGQELPTELTNVAFIQAVRKEWKSVTILLQNKKNLKRDTIYDIFGFLKGNEAHVLDLIGDQVIGGPLALISREDSSIPIEESSDDNEEENLVQAFITMNPKTKKFFRKSSNNRSRYNNSNSNKTNTSMSHNSNTSKSADDPYKF